MRILVLGAGVIGSVYACQLSRPDMTWYLWRVALGWQICEGMIRASASRSGSSLWAQRP